MKFILNFDLKNNIFKSDYRSTFVSFFKYSLENYMNGEFYDDFYGPDAPRKKMTWSIRFNNPVFKGEIIELGGLDMSMTLRISDQETAYVYFSSLLNMKNIAFNVGNDNQMILRSVRMVREPDVIGEFAVFKVLSPICIRLHSRETNKDQYLSVEDEYFENELKIKLNEDLGGYEEDINSLIFDFSKMKKVVVPVYGTLIDATIGTFLVQGQNNILNHIKNNGLGSRRNSGFGLVEQIY